MYKKNNSQCRFIIAHDGAVGICGIPTASQSDFWIKSQLYVCMCFFFGQDVCMYVCMCLTCKIFHYIDRKKIIIQLGMHFWHRFVKLIALSNLEQLFCFHF